MGKNRPKRDVGENQGRLGYTQGGLFFPCLNFIFLVHCFVSAKQYQAVCLKVRVNGSEMDHNVFLSSIHMLDPLIVIREVSTQIEDDFVLVYDHMPQTEYKEYVKQMLVKFEIENGRRLQPIRSVGLQTHLLSRGPDGSDHFTTDNVEYFFSPRMPILNCFGEEHNSPKSIWDPQVALFFIAFFLTLFKALPQAVWSSTRYFLSYDNICQVGNMKIWRNPLPMNGRLSLLKNFWSKNITKVIDTLHIHNHQAKCKELYNPKKLKDVYPSGNTVICEETFAWLGRYKQILNSLPKTQFEFVLHRLIIHRNKYTEHCYRVGKYPLLPSVKLQKKKKKEGQMSNYESESDDD